MFSYRTASICAIVILALLILLNFFINIGYIPYLVLFFICGIVIFYGSAFVNSGFYFKMICSAKTDERVIALTFDDGPTLITPLILDVLKEYNIKATFFVVGKRIKNNEEILNRIYEEGHLTGNHSYSHDFWFSNYPANKIQNELSETDKIIEKCTGKKTNLFRPPYGVTNPNICKAVKKMNYISIGWSLKSRDTVIKNGNVILNRLKRKVKPGDIILMHDTDIKIVNVLKEFIYYALKNGYEIVRIDKLLSIEGYKPKVTFPPDSKGGLIAEMSSQQNSVID